MYKIKKIVFITDLRNQHQYKDTKNDIQISDRKKFNNVKLKQKRKSDTRFSLPVETVCDSVNLVIIKVNNNCK